MRIAFICGPPCAGKTTLAHHVAHADDVVIDYDDIARALGSPAQWLHPEPWRTTAEQELQAAIARASAATTPGTAWVLRTAPRPTTRAYLATTWDAHMYVLDPTEHVCLQRAKATGRPHGTAKGISGWYHLYRRWGGDRDAAELLGAARSRSHVDVQ